MKKVLMPRYDGKVDLGTLNWSINSSGYFSATISDMKIGEINSTYKFAFCPNYPIYSNLNRGDYTDKGINYGYIGGEFTIRAKDTSISTDNPTTFKNGLSGVYLYYETTTQPSKTKLMTVIDKRYDGRVDLGTLNWEKATNNNRFRTLSLRDTIKPNASYGQLTTAIMCAKYTNSTPANIESLTPNDKSISIGGNTYSIEIYDSQYASLSAADFKIAMSGVYLFYETVTQNNKTRALGAVEPIYEGRVDLGTLSWYPFGDNGGFSSGGISSNAKRYAGTEEPFIKCKGYNPTWYWKPGEDKDISISPTGDIYIYNQGIEHTEQALKQALSGVYLYYETATQTRRF